MERTRKLLSVVSGALDSYELDEATKPFVDFVDDLSTWYIRRSRDRFKGSDQEDKNYAIVTTRTVLKNLAKIIAPFAPFLADYLWLRLRREGDRESVHLEK